MIRAQNVFLPEPLFRNDALKCLTEIAGLDPAEFGDRCDLCNSLCAECRLCRPSSSSRSLTERSSIQV